MGTLPQRWLGVPLQMGMWWAQCHPRVQRSERHCRNLSINYKIMNMKIMCMHCYIARRLAAAMDKPSFGSGPPCTSPNSGLREAIHGFPSHTGMNMSFEQLVRCRLPQGWCLAAVRRGRRSRPGGGAAAAIPVPARFETGRAPRRGTSSMVRMPYVTIHAQRTSLRSVSKNPLAGRPADSTWTPSSLSPCFFMP